MTPKPVPPSWAWNPPPQRATWSGPSWSLSPSGGSDRRGLWSLKLLNCVMLERLHSGQSLQKQAALWDDVEGNQHPHHKDQVQFRINSVEMIKNPTCMCGLAKWLKVPCCTQILRSLKNSSPQTLVVASLIRKPPQSSRILPVCWTLCFSLLLKLMLCWAFNVCMETQRK